MSSPVESKFLGDFCLSTLLLIRLTLWILLVALSFLWRLCALFTQFFCQWPYPWILVSHEQSLWFLKKHVFWRMCYMKGRLVLHCRIVAQEFLWCVQNTNHVYSKSDLWMNHSHRFPLQHTCARMHARMCSEHMAKDIHNPICVGRRENCWSWLITQK